MRDVAKASLDMMRACRELAATALDARGEVTVVEGNERHTGEPMTIRHIGIPDYVERMTQRVFHEGHRVISRRTIWHPLAAVEVRRGPPVDLQLIHLPEAYCRLCRVDALEMPCWVFQTVCLDGSWQDVTSRFRKKMRTTDFPKLRKQIRKHQLSYRVTHDERELRRFYDEMYVPYTQSRFGELAELDSYEEMLDEVRANGGLLLVTCQDRVVGGSDWSRDHETMEVRAFGLRTGLDRPIEDPVRSATYLFALQHAHQIGCRRLTFGVTHPFAADGAYRFKRKWGAAVHDTWLDSAFLWQPLTFHAPVQAFLAANPMLVRTRRGLELRILVNEQIDSKRLERLVNEYASPGIVRLHFFGHQASPGGEGDPSPNLLWTDLSGAQDPQKRLVSGARSRSTPSPAKPATY